ncbi:MAG: glycosyltransferase family 2 protein [Clostridia bacterium]|nr:glycosyltransferase family 2 protein [Clostridia bacterium]
MKKLSLCLIVKNEEKSLDDCLKNAKSYADEIIIVDTGSQDATIEIAKKYTDKIYTFKWCDDFSKARNFSFDQASCEYIMWLDADDIVPDESVQEIIKWKKYDDKIDVLMCRYVVTFDKNLVPIFEYYRERIVKNSKKFRWRDRVHEVITPSGSIVRNEKIAIYHNKKQKSISQRNLSIYRKMIDKNEKFSPRNQFYYARELYFNGFTKEAIHEFSKYLAEDHGWVENKVEACLNLAKCYQQEKEYQKALYSLFGSFVYARPRGEILYEVGNVFVSLKDYTNAVYWYKQALAAEVEIEGGGFVNRECYTFLPALQLCFLYSQLGDSDESYKYHKLAKSFRPDDERVKYNELYFQNLFKNGSK